MKMEFTPLTVIARNEGRFLVNSLGDDTVMMDTESGNYLAINTVATSIWNELEAPKTLELLLQKLFSEYEISEEQLKLEVENFLEKMLNLHLIIIQ